MRETERQPPPQTLQDLPTLTHTFSATQSEDETRVLHALRVLEPDRAAEGHAADCGILDGRGDHSRVLPPVWDGPRVAFRLGSERAPAPPFPGNLAYREDVQRLHVR